VLGYMELAERLGKTPGALRVMRSRGQLPEPDAPGPRWRPETIERWTWTAEGAAAVEAPVVASEEEPAAEPPVAVAPAPAVVEPAPDAVAVEAPPAPAPAPAPVPPATPASARPALSRPADAHGGLKDFRARTAREQLACLHPRAERQSLPWGARCGRCGLLAAVVGRYGGWDRESGSLPA